MMKFKTLAVSVSGILLLASQAFAEKATLKNQKEKVSYIIGLCREECRSLSQCNPDFRDRTRLRSGEEVSLNIWSAREV